MTIQNKAVYLMDCQPTCKVCDEYLFIKEEKDQRVHEKCKEKKDDKDD